MPLLQEPFLNMCMKAFNKKGNVEDTSEYVQMAESCVPTFLAFVSAGA